jgi:hypothetical protein
MKSIYEYIIEKLVINKDSIDKVKVPSDIVKRIWLPYPEHRDYMKMTEYQAKGSKPSTLVNTIKDEDKLLRRFRQALEMDWTEAIDAFAKGIVDRGIYTREEIDKYIEDNYKK